MERMVVVLFLVVWTAEDMGGLAMEDFLGIVIEQCLRDGNAKKGLNIVATRPGGWTFLLVSVPEQQLAQQVAVLQSSMVTDDNWYAHFFRGHELVVVFREAVFKVTTDAGTWGLVTEHGLAVGIPLEQLDFTPRTKLDAERFFGLSKA